MAEVKWIDDVEAARILDLSVKRVRQFGDAKMLRTRGETNPETNRPRTLYHAGDVERLREERLKRVKVTTRALVKQAAGEGLVLREPYSREEISSPPAAQFQPHEWLTFAEAAQYTRLPARVLVEAVKSGELKRRDVGIVKGHRFRVKVADLDGFAGVLAETARSAGNKR